MEISKYLDNIHKRYQLGNSTEHTFRGDLQQLIESIVPGIAATNEPQRQACGAPDYILTRKEIPIGFIEAKDIGDSDLDGLKKTGNKEQFDRYKASLSNLIFTDYLNFHLYRDGQLVMKVSIGELKDGKIESSPQNFDSFTRMIQDFCVHISQTIKSSKKLAEMMAGKAKLLADIIGKSLTSDVTNQENSTLKEQMHAFRELLIHDITPQGFADVYAQTIAYGMFAARLNDPTLKTFSRQEAAELIPKSNPFLRKLFGYIAGPDLDDRIKWIVDSLVDIFLASNVEEILMNYGKATKTEDPIIHFYETFLSAYDPKLRKARGVWYTPHPVVNFIVRAVDDVLKTEFDLPQGLADISKIKIKVEKQGKKVDQEFHRVQILDPAAGTGTFLAEVIRQIYSKFEGQEGIWSNYVENHLLPRLNGFEILMASYAMAHLKLDLLLTDTGYNPSFDQRFKVYLTNSLEEYHPDTGTIFTTWLSAEANEANRIKRDTPVMVVMGNPPYAVSSSNKGEWIQNLIADYKKNLNEKKINLDDDYIKFIRFGQYLIDKNENGILAYISNNSFIDGITHRQMRKSLINCFNKIYIFDLHGSAKKNEIDIDGSKDENVFDIQQGVSINLLIKSNKIENKDYINHSEIFGTRTYKYNFLENNNLQSIPWRRINVINPNYFFVPKNFDNEKSYSGFNISDMFIINGSGVKNERDDICKQFSLNEIMLVVNDFRLLSIPEIKLKYKVKDTRDWKVENAKQDVIKNDKVEYYIKNLYRPFDERYTYYTGTSRGFIGTPGNTRMQHLINKENISLISCRQQSTFDFQHAFISKEISDICVISSQTKETGYVFPLYLYATNNNQLKIDQLFERTPNLNIDIVNKFCNQLSVNYATEKQENPEIIAPVDILDYIYAVLHSPTYRKKYKEFLKIDFPRIPYPKDKDTFWQFVKLGGELRQIHLLENPVVEKYITKYPVDGDNTMNKVKYQDQKVYINDQQYFSNVPEIAWNFYIGGYQPAQKWLKDRKDRKLDFEDILHYQKIIVALTETDRLMKEIDQIRFE